MSPAYRRTLRAWYAAFCNLNGLDAAYAHYTFEDFTESLDILNGGGYVEVLDGLPNNAAIAFRDARHRAVHQLVHGPAVAVTRR